MRLLIVDDNAKRYQRLIEVLTSQAMPRDHIDIAVCAQDARNYLENKKYDLMVIDIVIPLRSDENADYKHSVELITEISETGMLIPPCHIVGITADTTAASKVSSFFEEKLWRLISYSETNDGWTTQISNCLQYIDSEKSRTKPTYHTDIAIICALPDPELKEVLKLPWRFKEARPIEDKMTFVHDGVVISNGKPFSVVAVAAPRMGMISTALTTTRIIEILRPKIIIMAGICAGIKGKVDMGDVIFADPVWGWESGKYNTDATGKAVFQFSPHQIPASPHVRTRIEQIKNDRAALSKIADDFNGKPPGILKVVIGPVASGSAVVANNEITENIKKQNRETCGIEMECYGLFAAAQMASNPAPISLAMKSVCDFGDASKNDDYQRYAAYTSAQTIRLFIEKFGSDFL